MIDIDTIEREILDLEKRDTSYATIERLAWLYIVKDHLVKEKESDQLGSFTGSEFCEVCSGVPMDSLMSILSDHMIELKAVLPREYDSILSKINMCHK